MEVLERESLPDLVKRGTINNRVLGFNGRAGGGGEVIYPLIVIEILITFRLN